MAECKGIATRCWLVKTLRRPWTWLDTGEYAALCGDLGLGGNDLLERETCLSESWHLERLRSLQSASLVCQKLLLGPSVSKSHENP